MFASFRLAHYRLTLEALEPLQLPPFKGSALRGGFGHTFKRLVCFQTQPCGQQCQRGHSCPYGYIFETAPPDNSEVLRTFSEVPRPFIIEPPDDPRTRIPAGERLTFGLTLIGRGMDYLAYFILVFQELGRLGLGRSQGQYRLLTIEAVSPYTGLTEPVYRADDELIRPADLTITGEMLTAHAASLSLSPPLLASSPPRLTLTFLTPTRLKHQGRWINEGPPFQVLIKALLGRISSLSYFHCGQRLEVDFRGLIDRAAGVEMVQSETHWEDWSRFSGRQHQWVEMGGLVGRISYAGDLQEYLPWLALGEFIHAGKGTVFGNGQYQIMRDQ